MAKMNETTQTTPADVNNMERIQATAAANPGTLVHGNTVGVLPTSTFDPQQVENQAYRAPELKPVSLISEDANKNVLSGEDAVAFAKNSMDYANKQANLDAPGLGTNFQDQVDKDTGMPTWMVNLNKSKQEAADRIAKQMKPAEEQKGANQLSSTLSEQAQQFRTGTTNTSYGMAEMNALAAEHQRDLDQFAMQKQEAINNAQDALQRGAVGEVMQAQANVAKIEAQSKQTKKEYYQEQSARLEMEDKIQKHGDEAITRMVKAGVVPTPSQLDAYDKSFGLPQGTSRMTYAIAQKDYADNEELKQFEAEEKKFSAEGKFADVQGKYADIEAKRFELQQKMINSKYETASKVVSVMNDLPLGTSFKIGDVEITGLSRGDIKTGSETDIDGNVTFWSFDQNSNKVVTTSLGNIGKKQDGWETKFDDNGQPWRLNKTTGQMVPFVPSQTQKDWQKSFPEGSVSPFKDAAGNPRTQCGAFANDMTGIGVGDTFESKMQKMNLWKKGEGDPNSVLEKLQIGDCFTQKLGTWTGHIGMFGGYETSPNGKIMIRAIESNYPKPGKITSTRLIPIEQIDGFGRGPKVSPLLQNGPDSVNTSAAIVGTGLPASNEQGQPAPTFGGKKVEAEKPLTAGQVEDYGLDPKDPSNIGISLDQAKAKREAMLKTEQGNAPAPEKGLNYLPSFEDFAKSQSWDTIADAKKMYKEQEAFVGQVNSVNDAIKRGKFANIPEKQEFIRQADDAIKNGDFERLNSVMKQVGEKSMDVDTQKKFNLSQNLAESYGTVQDILGEFANDPTFKTGNIKSILEKAKKTGAFESDPRYTKIDQILATFQNEYRNAIAGASLTPQEKAEVDKAIVNPAVDTAKDMWDKLETGKKLNTWLADVRLASALGLTRPKMSDYGITK